MEQVSRDFQTINIYSILTVGTVFFLYIYFRSPLIYSLSLSNSQSRQLRIVFFYRERLRSAIASRRGINIYVQKYLETAKMFVFFTD